MKVTDPIKSKQDIKRLKEFYLVRGKLRNNALIIVGLYTALRISDILPLKWGDFYNFKSKSFKRHLQLREQKTGKETKIFLNENLIKALEILLEANADVVEDSYIFASRNGDNVPIKRRQAYIIIKDAAEQLKIEGNIGCHSLRKTFGYQAWKNNVDPVLIMEIFNHSKFDITKRYLCISQEDKDAVFNEINY